MKKYKIGLLNKKRGNLIIQKKFVGADNIHDETYRTIDHHKKALLDAGYDICQIDWGENLFRDLKSNHIDLVFNVSSMAEAAILEELNIPFVGSGTASIALATDKSLAKKIWGNEGLKTSPFLVVNSLKDCSVFETNPPIDYPLFIKPIAGRGSAGIDSTSLVKNYTDLLDGVKKRLDTIRQPILIEKFLEGTELTVGIIGNDENIEILPPLEISFKDEKSFLTFEKKELDDDSFYCPPRSINADTIKNIMSFAKKAYIALGLRDYGRIDIMLCKDGAYLIEANSFAGLMCTPKEKPHSYIGVMAVEQKMDSSDLIHKIIKSALKRYEL